MSVESELVFSKFDKGRDDEVRCSQVVINGRPYLSISVFNRETGKFRGGVTMAPALMRLVVNSVLAALDNPVEPDDEFPEA